MSMNERRVIRPHCTVLRWSVQPLRAAGSIAAEAKRAAGTCPRFAPSGAEGQASLESRAGQKQDRQGLGHPPTELMTQRTRCTPDLLNMPLWFHEKAVRHHIAHERTARE